MVVTVYVSCTYVQQRLQRAAHWQSDGSCLSAWGSLYNFRYQKDGSCHPGGTRPRQSTWNNLCGATRFILRVVLAAPPNAGCVDILVFEQPNSVYTLGMNARPMPCDSASFHCMTFRLMQLYRGSRKVDRPQRGTRSSITLVAFIVDLSTVHTVDRSGTPSLGEDEGSCLRR